MNGDRFTISVGIVIVLVLLAVFAFGVPGK